MGARTSQENNGKPESTHSADPHGYPSAMGGKRTLPYGCQTLGSGVREGLRRDYGGITVTVYYDYGDSRRKALISFRPPS